MQNKGAIRLFAIAFALVCLYQLSFTWVASRVEKKAEIYADNFVKKQFPDKIGSKDETTIAFLDSVRASKEYSYKDSMKGEDVYNLLIRKYTYAECLNRQINLGLDLKGGMNVILEVSVEDVLRSLANYSTDTTFTKALALAKQMQKTQTGDYVTLFAKAFKTINPNGQLASIFSTFELKDKINPRSTDKEVLDVLRKETNDAIENSFNILRTRIDKFGVIQPNIQPLETKGRILVALPGIKEPERMRRLLQGTANLEFWETYENSEIFNDLVKANQIIKDMQVSETKTADSLKNQTATTTNIKEPVQKAEKDTSGAESLAERLANAPDTTGNDSTQLINKVGAEYPLFSSYSILKPAVSGQNQLAAGAMIGSANVRDTAKVMAYLNLKQVHALFPLNIRFLWSMKPEKRDKSQSIYDLYAIKGTRDGRPPLDGSAISSARSEFGQNKASAEVAMSMNPEGAKKWAHLTKDNVGRCIAIVLDNSVASAPVVQTEITGGNSSITGNFTPDEAGDLAITLKSGRMPAPAHIISEAIVGPSLGEASVKAGLASFVIAFLIVLIYMMFYYNRAGWIADVALMVNVFFIFGVLASLSAVLTLPGIAGIVLTLGMAVDANVIIYERIREELRAGKSLKTAIADGYHNAYSAIIDGNVTTLLTGIVLFIFGTGPIQGFATTLIIGILTSLFTAIFISRLIFEGLLGRNRSIKFSNRFTESVLHNAKFDFIGKRKMFYVGSSIIILAGIISMFVRGYSLGIDFKGGRTYFVRFNEPVNTPDIQKSLTVTFDGDIPEVKTYGGENQIQVTTKYLIDQPSDAQHDIDSIVESRLYKGLIPYLDKNTNYDSFLKSNVLSSEKVGPTIALDIKIKALYSVFFALIIIFLYIFIRFRDWRFGLGGVVSLAHDSLFVLGIYSLLWGHLPFSMEIDQSFIAAILTVIGYSINDSVIIFDRIREYTALYPKRSKKDVYNSAMNSTLGRTLNTSLTTLFLIIVIFVFGGEVIRGFIFALLIGIGVGTYSSICNAAPIVYDTLMRKLRKEELAK